MNDSTKGAFRSSVSGFLKTLGKGEEEKQMRATACETDNLSITLSYMLLSLGWEQAWQTLAIKPSV